MNDIKQGSLTCIIKTYLLLLFF